ncbi:hypothetical protein FS837_006948 [Tulasnella sp. UAMH 9824]|nr:hypothetical protein FS837_006948 [Tulasnella sp. UAMH 9824]
MAPFFSKPLFKRKKKHPVGVAGETIVEEEHHYGGTDSHVYSLSGGDPYGHQQHVMASQVPPKQPSRWKSVLRRKPLPQEQLIPHDQHFIDSEYHSQPLTVSGPHTTGGPTVLPGVESTVGHHYETTVHPIQVLEDGSSGSDEHRVLHRNHSHGHSHGGSLRRHQTGVSQVQTILPHDSASNIHVEYVPQHTGVRPLQGIVEEQSDIEYKSVRSQHTGAPIQQQFVSTHPIGHGLHLHQVAPHGQQNGRLPPLEVTDGHGRRQRVQEVILDGSGIQEIPMPADGNVIFIVEEGVTLDVKDPETGEYIPLEEWYRRLAERTPPKPQDRYIVVNGDASNIIVEDADGHIIHRGERVKSEYIHRHEMERSHSHSSGSHSRAGSPHSHSEHHSHQHNTHPDPQLRLYTTDPKSPGGMRPLTDHLVIATPPKQQFQHPAVVSVRPPGHGRAHRRANSAGSSRSSSASSSSRSKRSSASSQHAGQFTRGPNGLMTASEMETTPEPSVLGVTSKPVDYFSINPHGHQDPNGPVENFETPPTGVYLSSIPEGSREFLPPKHHQSQTSLATRSIGRSASHRSKASTTGPAFMAMPEPVHFGTDGQPLPPGTPASEFGHASAQNSPISYKSHKSHKSKARTASVSGASVHPSMAPPRSSNAVSFADNALVINAYPDPESTVMMDETGHVLEPIAAGTPRSMRPSISQTPAVAAIHLPEGSPAQSVRAMSPVGSARVVSPVPSNRAMTPSRGMSPVVSLRNVAPAGSPMVQEIIMPSPQVSAPPSRRSSKKSRRDILAGAEPSPPPVPPITMPEPEHFVAEPVVEEPAFVVEPPQVVEIHDQYPVPDGAVDLSSPPHTPAPFQPLSRTVSAKSKASKASKASKTSKSGGGWGLWGWGGNNKQEEEEAQEEEAEEEGGFPGGFTNPLAPQPTGASSASRHTAAPLPAQATGGSRFSRDPGPPLAAQPTGGSRFSRDTSAPLAAQPTGGSTFSRHTGAPLTVQPTGGSTFSRHTATPLTAQPTGASGISRHNSVRSINTPVVERIASPSQSPQNARGSPQRGLPAIPGSPLYDPNALPEESAPPPLSIHTDLSRRPSLASRLHSATGSSANAPSIISNHIAMPEPQVDLDPYPSPGGLPSVHESYGSNRHTKHSGSMSFVQEPLEGEFMEPVVHVSPVEVDKDPATGSRRVSAVVSVTGGPAVIEMPAPVIEMPAPVEMPTPIETPKEEEDADWAQPKKKAAKKGGAGGKKGGKKK